MAKRAMARKTTIIDSAHHHPPAALPPGEPKGTAVNASIRLSAVVAGLLALAACGYRAKPLDIAGIQRELNGLRLDAQPASMSGQASDGFDAADGLDLAETAAIAVALNPELRAERAERGLAEAQLIEARLLPNPDLDGRWLTGEAMITEATALFDLTDGLAARGPRKERARLRVEEVQWDIAAREWALAHEAQRAWIDLAVAAATVDLQNRNWALAEHTATLAEARRAQGEATELDVVQAQADLASAIRLQQRQEGAREVALRRLNRLLGIAPGHPTRLQDPERALEVEAFAGDLETAAIDAITRRPDLRAAQAAYGVSEKDLQLAYRLRWPRLRLGPSVERDSGGSSLGLGFSLEVPIFNHGQGAIAERTATRQQAWDRVVAKVLAAESDIQESWWEATSSGRELATWRDEVLPRLDRELAVVMATLDAGEIDMFRLISTQARLVSARRDYLDLIRQHLLARNRWNEMLGPDVAGKP